MNTNSDRQLANIQQVVTLAEQDFNKLAKIHNAVNFQQEASFALQALKNNPYLTQVAMGDQDSLKTAILNVASIGLSLSPVHKLAYLVPRKGKICLDISYRGYVQLAVDVGAIKWAIAEVVCASDKFELRGVGVEPLHAFSPFGDRGKIVGAYCIAKTHDGDYLTTPMNIDEIFSIRDRSESWKSFMEKNKTSPWQTDQNEMIKKTVIRRAYKSWPMINTRQRLDQAIDISAEVDPIDFSGKTVIEAKEDDHALPKMREMLLQIARTEDQFMEHLERVFKRKIKNLNDLTEIEITQATVMLEGFVANIKPKEVKNENVG